MDKLKELRMLINGAVATDGYHKYSPFQGYPVITDGVLAVAKAANCFWFLDVIGSYQGNKHLSKIFQVWTLNVDLEKCTAVVTGCNDATPVVTQVIGFTDFPLEEFTVYCINGVILLPSEY